MFIEDIKTDFYDVLLGNRVLLLVHYDVDAICTCKILQELFKCDNISYTLVPVGGISELKSAYEENNEEIKYVVLVNCGGTIDLVDILQPEEHVVFFVLDSHKPTDICNVYSDGQVRIVYKDSEENIPNFDDIFRDDEDENEEQASGMEALEAVVERKRARRAWEERRHTLMFNYTQFSYYGKPSAMVALEVAWRASRDGAGVQWAAAVALAAAAAAHARPPAAALLDAHALHRRLAHRQSCGTAVVLENDVWLPLYRSWSLEAALRHSPDFGPHLKLHTLAGDSQVRQLLADMGYPLAAARQAFGAMDVELRRGLAAALGAAAARRRLPAAARPALLLRRAAAGSRRRAALDLAYGLMALLEHESLPRGVGFQKALWALDVGAGGDDTDGCEAALQAARAALQAAAAVAHATLAGRRLHLAGPFSYFIVQEGSAEAGWVRGPLWLGVAARWVARAASPRARTRPLVASAPLTQDHCILLGIPPNFEEEPRNLFGAAFEQAASRCGASVKLDYADTSVISLPVAQRAQFLDALTALLA